MRELAIHPLHPKLVRGRPARISTLAAMLFLLLVAVRPGNAEQPSPAGSVPSQAREVAEIRVYTRNVFDTTLPGEDRWLFRLVNKIHFTTRTDFLARAVPIRVGQFVTDDDVHEAERILRRFSFLRLVEIRQVGREDGRIDLEVWARDAWTTKIGLSFGGGGGETRFKVGAEETNLFGLGKSLAFEFDRTPIRTTKSISYDDPRFLDSDRRLQLEYLNNSDGQGYRASIEVPLLRGADPFGWSVEGVRLTEELPIYRSGEESSRVSRKTSAFIGEAIWTINGSAVETLRTGLRFEPRSEEFEPIELSRPDDLPHERRRADILVLLRKNELRFRSEAYINRFSRVEDIPTGLDAEIRVGVSPEALAGNDTIYLLGGILGGGFDTYAGNFGTARLTFDTRYGPNSADRTGKVDLEAVGYFRSNWPENAIGVAHLRYGFGWRLEPHERYLLGGDNGLRGYDAHSFDGQRSFLVNFEYRVSGTSEFLKLVQLGGAAFLDAGTARDQDALSPKNWKASAGLGLRFGIPRAARTNVIRLDVAYPFSPDERGKRGYVISFGSNQAF